MFTRTSEIVELELAGRVIGTTVEHPFFVPAQGEFVAAKDLQVGDELVSHDGRLIKLDAIRSTSRVTTVYNMRVADHHTYFVGGSAWGFDVWVHNAICGWNEAYANGWERVFGKKSVEAPDEVVGSLAFNHKLKPNKATDTSALNTEIGRHVEAWNAIIKEFGMIGLKQRLRQWEQYGDKIEAVGRKFTKSLGSAGKGKVWPHYPDMATGGRPKSAVGPPTDLRLNSIIGGQADRIRRELLEMSDETTKITFRLKVEG